MNNHGSFLYSLSSAECKQKGMIFLFTRKLKKRNTNRMRSRTEETMEYGRASRQSGKMEEEKMKRKKVEMERIKNERRKKGSKDGGKKETKKQRNKERNKERKKDEKMKG